MSSIEMLRWDEKQCRLTPGERVLGMVISILHDRTALWRLHEVFADQDLAVLFRTGITPDDFNDDALARVPDKLTAT